MSTFGLALWIVFAPRSMFRTIRAASDFGRAVRSACSGLPPVWDERGLRSEDGHKKCVVNVNYLRKKRECQLVNARIDDPIFRAYVMF